jgi:thiamine biosynthesis lipoprotein
MLVRLALHAMGTRFELVLEGDDDGPGAEAHLRAAGEEALAEVEQVDARLSLFRRDSLLSHIQRNAADQPVKVDPDTFALFELCAQVCEATGGAFDPTVAPLMRAYELHDDKAMTPLVTLEEAREQVGWRGRVELLADPHRVAFSAPGTAIDLGAIAKGHALDLAIEVLREAGVTRALMHGGTSTVAAIGHPQGREGWPIALGPGPHAPRVLLRDDCLAVSAPGARSVQHEGRRVDHVLDPRQGLPAHGALVAATLSQKAAEADAWSTALLVNVDPKGLPQHMESLIGMTDREGERVPTHWFHRPRITCTGPSGFCDIPQSRQATPLHTV